MSEYDFPESQQSDEEKKKKRDTVECPRCGRKYNRGEWRGECNRCGYPDVYYDSSTFRN